MDRASLRVFVAAFVMAACVGTNTYASHGDYPEQDELTDTCMRTWLATCSAAIGSGATFLGFASCTAGVCPVIVATTTSSLLTASGLSAALNVLAFDATETCAQGALLSCLGYVAVPIFIGGVAGYMLIKGYDHLRLWHQKRT